MTLSDAARYRKRFKRPLWDKEFALIIDYSGEIVQERDGKNPSMTLEDIEARDWEVL